MYKGRDESGTRPGNSTSRRRRGGNREVVSKEISVQILVACGHDTVPACHCMLVGLIIVFNAQKWLQGGMAPEWCGTVSCYFQKKYRVDWLKQLYQVLADKEVADNKLWAGTNELIDIRSVSLVQWCCD